ncbi:MAG: hypothetical protein ACI4IF_05765 [Acutalibacteraceae bacterium]
MKKVLAIFLSVLFVCACITPMGYALADAGLQTRVIEGDYNSKTESVEAVEKTTFTVVVQAPKVTKLTGVNIYFTFDPSVLSVKDAGPACGSDGNANFNGIAVHGFKNGTNNQYSFGWISSNGVTKSAARDLFYITFNVINTSKSATSVALHIEEFRTDDGNDANDITVSQLADNKVINFAFPEGTPPADGGDPTETTNPNGGTSIGEINSLLDLIRTILEGNGASFGDFADAIANILGNAEITDIIEQLVDGNISISEAFKNILEDMGISLDGLKEILNKIIEFIKGLIDGDDDNKTTTATTKPSGGSDVATTAKGSSSGSEEMGDVGIVLAATVCLAATAAFVLTRKKKEEV